MIDRPGRPVQLRRAASGPSGGTERASAGAIIGRRTLRSGQRALIGGLLIAAAAVVVFAAALSTAGTGATRYVVAARALPAGSVIQPGDTTTARLGLSGATRDSAFRQADAVVGRVVAVAVPAGQLIEASMLSTASRPDLRPVSIPVDSTSLASLSVGQGVDVLAAPGAPTASSSSSGPASPVVTVVVRGATLLAVGRADSGLLSGAASATEVVTLGVADLAEVEQLVQAAHAGTVVLVAAEPSDGTGPGPGAP